MDLSIKQWTLIGVPPFFIETTNKCEIQQFLVCFRQIFFTDDTWTWQVITGREVRERMQIAK